MSMATDSEAGGLLSRSPKPTGGRAGETTGTLDDCEKVLSSLEAEADCILERFLVTLEHGRKFAPALDKIEGQLETVARKQYMKNELELNEAAVLADKLSEELDATRGLADGAMLSDVQEEWAGGYEEVRASIDRLNMHMNRIKNGIAQEGEGVIEARSALISFSREARGCKSRLDSLKRAFSKKDGPHARVADAKKRAGELRAGVGRAYASLMRERLGRKIDEAKDQIVAFIMTSESGRIFVDRKHLTLTSEDGRKMRVPLTQSVKFSLEEIAPIESELARLDKSVVVGRFDSKDGTMLMRIGERAVVGDSVVYNEKSFLLN